MAVDSKQTSTTTPTVPPTNGAAKVDNGQAKRRKRPSSLLAVASSLPSVENSLEDFIARANQTLVDASTWDQAEKVAKQEDSKQREADALRWKAAEQQLREGEVRERTLRGQLDGLQGKLAEAEARAAVAGSQGPDPALLDLKSKVQWTEDRLRDAEDRAMQLANELVSAKTAVNTRPPVEIADFDQQDAEDRVRVAEAKASKAIAAAKAAAAGLTVSQADLAAIESGLIVTDIETPKKTPWLGIFIAFAGGIAIMFAVSKYVLGKDKDTKQTAPVTQPSVTQPEVAAPAPNKPTVTPIVTPIDEPTKPEMAQPEAAKQPEPAQPQPEAAKQPEPVQPAVAKQPEPAQPEVATQPVPTKQPVPVAAKKTPAPAPVHHAAPAPVHHAAPAPKHTPAAAKPAGDIADPFGGGTPAPAKKTPAKKPADKKPAGGIADPF